MPLATLALNVGGRYLLAVIHLLMLAIIDYSLNTNI